MLIIILKKNVMWRKLMKKDACSRGINYKTLNTDENDKNFLRQLTLLFFWQYIVVTIVMMFLYTGGNRYAPETTHFVLDQNYLSDLGRTINFVGKTNSYAVFYTITLSLVGVGIFLFFVQVTRKITSKLKYLVILLSLISATSYIGIALYPVDVDIATHIKFGRAAFFSFFFTSVLFHILIDKKEQQKTNYLLFILNTLLFAYLLLMLFGPSSSQGVWALQLKTIAQKVVVYSQITLSLLILKKPQYRNLDSK